MRRFRESLKAPFPFLSDGDGRVSSLYAGVSMGTANRATVSIDTDGKITHVTTGLGAIFPADDINACPSHQGAPAESI